MPQASLHIRRVVVAVAVLLGQFAENLYDISFQKPVEGSSATECPRMFVEDSERDVEDRSLSDVATQGVKDRLVGSARTHWYRNDAPKLLTDA